MSKIDILPPLLTRIGFNETDIKVYSATLGLGKVTIGELLVVTGLDPLTLIQSVKNLEELGFLKKITGRTPEYFGMLPFLKEYIVVEKDALYSIDGVITSLKEASLKSTVLTFLVNFCSRSFSNSPISTFSGSA